MYDFFLDGDKFARLIRMIGSMMSPQRIQRQIKCSARPISSRARSFIIIPLQRLQGIHPILIFILCRSAVFFIFFHHKGRMFLRDQRDVNGLLNVTGPEERERKTGSFSHKAEGLVSTCFSRQLFAARGASFPIGKPSASTSTRDRGDTNDASGSYNTGPVRESSARRSIPARDTPLPLPCFQLFRDKDNASSVSFI